MQQLIDGIYDLRSSEDHSKHCHSSLALTMLLLLNQPFCMYSKWQSKLDLGLGVRAGPIMNIITIITSTSTKVGLV